MPRSASYCPLVPNIALLLATSPVGILGANSGTLQDPRHTWGKPGEHWGSLDTPRGTLGHTEEHLAPKRKPGQNLRNTGHTNPREPCGALGRLRGAHGNPDEPGHTEGNAGEPWGTIGTFGDPGEPRGNLGTLGGTQGNTAYARGRMRK